MGNPNPNPNPNSNSNPSPNFNPRHLSDECAMHNDLTNMHMSENGAMVDLRYLMSQQKFYTMGSGDNLGVMNIGPGMNGMMQVHSEQSRSLGEAFEKVHSRQGLSLLLDNPRMHPSMYMSVDHDMGSASQIFDVVNQYNSLMASAQSNNIAQSSGTDYQENGFVGLHDLW